MSHIRATEKPRWHQLRWKLSNLIMRLARWVKPNNPDVMAFYAELMHDYMIYGQSVVRVPPEKWQEDDLQNKDGGRE